MTKLVHLLAVVCLICIAVTSSLPGCLSARPFPADEESDAGVAATIEPTVVELNPMDSDASVTSMSFEFSEFDEFLAGEGDEDTTLHPCYAPLDETEMEGRTDASTADGDIPMVEVDCRRMLASRDYPVTKPNTNTRCGSGNKC